MKRGYVRVSTDDQSVDLQVNALTDCDELYIDHGVSGAAVERPELSRLLADLEPGDHVVVWRLDRLGRSLQHLIELSNDFRDRDVAFSSITDNVDTSTSSGRLFFGIMATLAEFERELISERITAGMAAAKARGSAVGRPKRMSGEQVAQARQWVIEGKARREIARLFRVSPATLYRHLAA